MGIAVQNIYKTGLKETNMCQIEVMTIAIHNKIMIPKYHKMFLL
jgi:hypothetical protein